MKTAEYLIKDFYQTEVTTCEEYAEVFLTKKIINHEREQITSSVKAYNILQPWFISAMETQEIFVVAYLDTANKITYIQKLSMGGLTATIVDIRLILSTALLTLSAKLILAHNHPSGQVQPSKADQDITKKLKEACKFFDIEVIDHIILTAHDYYSFADDGNL